MSKIKKAVDELMEGKNSDFSDTIKGILDEGAEAVYPEVTNKVLSDFGYQVVEMTDEDDEEEEEGEADGDDDGSDVPAPKKEKKDDM